MAIVKRTKTYPDGRVEVEEIDMDKQKITKRTGRKTDESENKPKEKRKPVRKTYKTTSSS